MIELVRGIVTRNALTEFERDKWKSVSMRIFTVVADFRHSVPWPTRPLGRRKYPEAFGTQGQKVNKTCHPFPPSYLARSYMWPQTIEWPWSVNSFHLKTTGPVQNDRHFSDDIFKFIFLNENLRILMQISPTVCFEGRVQPTISQH